ncbi:Radical SAM domain protein [Acetonema longum DSM 6540]|uniref:Radical SAM domain protein n=1 Tax=Acetonema longum DSM 6540 TaxID=1009370 RepID=F7NGH5_9FIRM|nr:Radical SAM domain protein [Acetonema longum DSM 6540]
MDTKVDLAAIANGRRLEPPAAEALLKSGDILELGVAADTVRQRFHPGDTVTFIVDRNINYTNICESECRFCAFSGSPDTRRDMCWTMSPSTPKSPRRWRREPRRSCSRAA